LVLEYIHTSSLVIDDLPCMDNAEFRRGNICVHKKYGEAIAQIASVSLLSLGMDALCIQMGQNSLQEYSVNSTYLFKHLSSLFHMASEGQLMDLQSSNKDIGKLLKDKNIELEEIIYKKTGSFFEIGFEMGWLLGGKPLEQIEKIKSLSNSFSMSFQIIDDIDDMEEDIKSKNINYAVHYGKDLAIQKAQEYLNQFSKSLEHLELNSLFFTNLVEYLQFKLNNFIKMNEI
jgi:geranylgeranyl diphosphate synthase type II